MLANDASPATLISVVVPSFNQGRYLEATLQSLLDQGDPRLEILVVDGGSRDHSVSVLQRYASRLAWWVSEPDRGQSHAINKGFSRAGGEWLTWLNSDDILRPGALAEFRRQSATCPERQWWIGGGEFIDARGRRLGTYGAPQSLSEPAQLADWRSFWFAQPGTIFRRSLFEQAGGRVREDLHYAMDLELWLRLLAHAAPGRMEGLIAGYRLHDDAKTSVLTAKGEMEIMRILIEALGADASMARVECIARDRQEFQTQYLRLLGRVRPLVKGAALARRLLRLGPPGGRT